MAASVAALVAGELGGVADAVGLATLTHEVIAVVVTVLEREVVAELVGDGAGGLVETPEAADGAIHAFLILVGRTGAVDGGAAEKNPVAAGDVHVVGDEEVDAVVGNLPVVGELFELAAGGGGVKAVGVGDGNVPVQDAADTDGAGVVDVAELEDGVIEVLEIIVGKAFQANGFPRESVDLNGLPKKPVLGDY